MDQYTPANPSRRPKRPSALLLIVTGAVVTVLFGGLFTAFLVIFAGQQALKSMTAAQVVASIGVVVLGIVLVVVLAGGAVWTLNSLLGRRSRSNLLKASAERTLKARALGSVLHREVEDEPRPAVLAEAGTLELAGALDDPMVDKPLAWPAGAAGEADTRGDRHILDAILVQIRELNENILMSQEQRSAKAAIRHDKLRRKLVEEAQAAIDAADFARAGQLVQALAERIPGDENILPLQERLEKARQAARGEEIEASTRSVNDMMAVGAFDRAEAEALDLKLRYPNDQAVTDLLNRVRREGRMFRNERHDRMYNEVVRLAEGRQWRKALKAARQYVQEFPTGASADAVGAMLATMEDNARIEEVRELRDHIRDLLERRRYSEAIDYARDVIERFPDTRAAEELSRQMNRLRELAHSEPANGLKKP